jgi:hypothetical protein
MKYDKLVEKLQKDPEFYRQYRERQLKSQRKLATDREFRLRRAKATADWRYRKERGLPTRPRVIRKPQTPLLNAFSARIECVQKPQEKTFDFTLVPEISVAFD